MVGSSRGASPRGGSRAGSTRAMSDKSDEVASVRPMHSLGLPKAHRVVPRFLDDGTLVYAGMHGLVQYDLGSEVVSALPMHNEAHHSTGGEAWDAGSEGGGGDHEESPRPETATATPEGSPRRAGGKGATHKVLSNLSLVHISGNRKVMAVVEDSGDGQETVLIYQASTMRQLRSLPILPEDIDKTKRITSIAFSTDAKFVAVQTVGRRFSQTLVYEWRGKKLVAQSADAHGAHKVSFDPSNSTMLAVQAAHGHRLQFARYRHDSDEESANTQTLKLYAPQFLPDRVEGLPSEGFDPAALTFMDHAWLKGQNLVALTREGYILVCVDTHYTRVISDVLGPTISCFSICVLQDGFAVGGAGGRVHVYDFESSETGDSGHYAITRRFRGADHMIVHHMSASPSQASLMCSIASVDQVNAGKETLMAASGILHIRTSEFAIADMGRSGKESEDEEGSESTPGDGKDSDKAVHSLRALPIGLHRAGLVAMQVSPARNALMTFGTDQNVCLIDLRTGRHIFKQTLDDPILSAALHPSGFYVAIGNHDRFRIYHVLDTGLSLIREMPYGSVSNCAFSNGGAYLAASSAVKLVLIDFWDLTFRAVDPSSSRIDLPILADLRGHGAPIKGLAWAPGDGRLVSIDRKGACYEWSMDSFERVAEYVQKGVEFSNVAYFSRGGAAHLRSLEDYGEGEPPVPVNSLYQVMASTSSNLDHVQGGEMLARGLVPVDENVCSFAIGPGGDVVYVGLASGVVLSCSWEQWSARGQHEYNIFKKCVATHFGPVQHMCIGPAGNVLYSVSEDGCVVASVLGSAETNMAAWEKAEVAALGSTGVGQVTLVDLSTHVERLDELEELGRALRQSELGVKFKLEMQAQTLRDEALHQEKRWHAEKRNLQKTVSALNADKEHLEKSSKEVVVSIEKAHHKAAEELELLYERKLMDEAKKLKNLSMERDDMRFSYEEKIRSLGEMHRENLKVLSLQYDQRLQDSSRRLEDMQETLVGLHQEMVEGAAISDAVFEDEATKLDQAAIDARSGAERAVLEANTKLGLFRRSIEHMRKRMEVAEEQAKASAAAEASSAMQVAELTEENEIYRQKVATQMKQLNERDKELDGVRRESRETHKVNWVLDHKLEAELLRAAPMEDDISSLKEQISKMTAELRVRVQQKNKLDAMLGERAGSIQVLSKECKKLREGKERMERRMRSMESEVAHLVRNELSVPALVNGLKKVYTDYCMDEPRAESARGSRHPSESKEMARGTPHNPQDMETELERQRRQLEGQMLHWRRKYYESEERIQKDYKNFIAENSNMLGEVNDLRKENKGLRIKVRQLSARHG